MSILTKNSNGVEVLKLFETGIHIDTKLPKWVNACKRINSRKQFVNYDGDSADSKVYSNNPGDPFTVYHTPEAYEIPDNISFDEVAAANLKELTELIKDGKLNNVLSGYGGMHGWRITNISNNAEPWEVSDSGPTPINTGSKSSLTGRIKGFFRYVGNSINYIFNKPQMDAIKFFTTVKLTSKESAETYRDRVSKYLKAVHNANMIGQTALVEKLLSEMIANKYEALLYSTGKYYVITEEQLVNFAKKTEKSIDLCYIKNYARPIPSDVIDQVAKVNELEVFDNYVVLFYDSKGTSKRETKKEEAKRKDPIIFGVIAGSNKLYYITDWVDEYCDLTLEKFVDIIGVEKDSLLDGGPLNVEKKPEAPKGENKEPKKGTRKKSSTKKK